MGWLCGPLVVYNFVQNTVLIFTFVLQKTQQFSETLDQKALAGGTILESGSWPAFVLLDQSMLPKRRVATVDAVG